MSLREDIIAGDVLQVMLKLQGVDLTTPYPGWNTWTPLSYAAYTGTSDVLSALLQTDIDTEVKHEGGKTLLHVAVQGNMPKNIEVLLQHGADVNSVDILGNTPLHDFAIRSQYMDCAKALLENGANINALNVLGETPLYTAIQYRKMDILKFLLENGADVDILSVTLHTPIHFAVMFGGSDAHKCMAPLLGRGIDINARDTKGKTALHHAARHGHMKHVSLLLQSGADVNIEDNDGKKAYQYAVAKHLRELLKDKTKRKGFFYNIC